MIRLALFICFVAWVPPGLGVYHNQSATWYTASLLHPDAYFGFSVTYEPTSKRLIVGAPKADDIGEVYSCDIDSTVCISVQKNIKRYDHNYNHSYWFGAVVKAGPSYFVTCSPLSVDGFVDKEKNATQTLVGTFGRCFKYTKHSGLPVSFKFLSNDDRKKDTTLFEQKMDSFGWSIDISDDNVIIGGPAMFTGRAIKYYDVNKPPVSLTGINTNANKRVDYNFGYSVVTGYFRTAGKKFLTYAIGSPYGRSGRGTVSFYSSFKKTDMHHQGDLSCADESTVGAMFGAVLCAARFTPGAVATALLVGAPTFATKHTQNLGAVYIYAAGKLPLSQLIRRIVGQHEGGFFGSAIVSVGDLNGDGRDEIAIGAPYEDSGAGAVYLYSSAEIMSEKGQIGWMQRLAPRPAERQRAFGLSLSPVQDYDDNGCNELAIGAPESNKVMLIRCIVAMTVRLYEEVPDLRKLKGKDNPFRTDTHFTFKSCIEAIYPDKPKNVKAHIKVHVVISHPDAKLAHAEDKEFELFLDRNSNSICREILVETPENGNYGFPIMYKIKAKQLENPMDVAFDPQRVALSDLSKLNSSGSIWIAECSDTNNCMPKLKFMDTILSVRDPYVIGSTPTIDIDVAVTNEGEVAYDPCLRVSFVNSSVAQVPPDCERVNGTELKCAPKQLLRTHHIWSTQSIPLDVTHLTNEYERLTIHIKMYNHCTENTFETQTRTITLMSSSNGIFVKGVTDAGLDNTINMTKSDVPLGKSFEQSYTISNSGPTNWVGVTATLVVQKRSFIEYYPVILSVDSLPLGLQKCDFESEDEHVSKFSCVLEKLYKNDGVAKITVPMFVKPGALETAVDQRVNTINSILALNFNGTIKTYNINSVINLKDATVPIWIILAASLIGLIILLIIFLILRECGFFRREKKENLEKVRRSVKRQTIMRRSMMDGVRLPPGPDRQSLIDPEAKEPAAGDRRLRVNDATAP